MNYNCIRNILYQRIPRQSDQLTAIAKREIRYFIQKLKQHRKKNVHEILQLLAEYRYLETKAGKVNLIVSL